VLPPVSQGPRASSAPLCQGSAAALSTSLHAQQSTVRRADRRNREYLMVYPCLVYMARCAHPRRSCVPSALFFCSLPFPFSFPSCHPNTRAHRRTERRKQRTRNGMERNGGGQKGGPPPPELPPQPPPLLPPSLPLLLPCLRTHWWTCCAISSAPSVWAW
jgi:hypothetical protein